MCIAKWKNVLAAMSPQLTDCNPLTDVLVIKNLPSDN